MVCSAWFVWISQSLVNETVGQTLVIRRTIILIFAITFIIFLMILGAGVQVLVVMLSCYFSHVSHKTIRDNYAILVEDLVESIKLGNLYCETPTFVFRLRLKTKLSWMILCWSIFLYLSPFLVCYKMIHCNQKSFVIFLLVLHKVVH